jgi:hypothetical protein
LEEFCKYNAHFLYLQSNRLLKQDHENARLFPNTDRRTYVRETLRKLKQRRNIDLADLTLLLEDFKLI